jgi:hypothetical protein
MLDSRPRAPPSITCSARRRIATRPVNKAQHRLCLARDKGRRAVGSPSSDRSTFVRRHTTREPISIVRSKANIVSRASLAWSSSRAMTSAQRDESKGIRQRRPLSNRENERHKQEKRTQRNSSNRFFYHAKNRRFFFFSSCSSLDCIPSFFFVLFCVVPLLDKRRESTILPGVFVVPSLPTA